MKGKYFSLICLFGSFVLGGLIADYLNTETEIKLSSSMEKTAQQRDGDYAISYYTTNPVISNFYLDCPPSGTYDFFGPYYNCIVLRTDGNAGKLELEVPNSILQGREIEKVNGGFFFLGLPFQYVSNDGDYTIIRIDVPKGVDEIDLVGGDKPSFFRFLIYSAMWGGLVLLILLWPMIKILDRMEQKRDTKSRKY